METKPIRNPTRDQVRAAQMTRYAEWLQRTRGLSFTDYDAMWQWSVDDLEGFWASLWEYFDLRADAPYAEVLANRSMPGAKWFPGATLNYVDQVFRHATDARPAIVFGNESGTRSTVGWQELRAQVASLAASLRQMGVQPGDRVAAYLPNNPQTIVAFLACASVGGVWSICSPDMGRASVLDRFRQIEPKVLIACDGNVYAGKRHDRSAVVANVLQELPSVRHLVWVGILDPESRPSVGIEVQPWAAATGLAAAPDPVALPFDHPLWIVYSSGTTGLPKPIVHGHGGIVLENLKMAVLHNDLGPNDRFFWYSSTGWIMWNLQVAGLLTGATVCIFDGSPNGSGSEPDMYTLWRFAADSGATFFGAGAAFYTSCLKAGIAPGHAGDLSRVRAVGSTGSPLPPDVEQWLSETLEQKPWVTAISGGTDFASAFVGGNPAVPNFLGEMQCRCLGARVEAWNDAGQPVIDEVGELVCAAPMPSMPLYFWNDTGNQRYRESYFDVFPGVWRHGDWIRINARPSAHSAVIYGRSDATINRHGIRMGTAELYNAVEGFPEVLDSLVVDLEYLGRESYMPLFVVLRPGAELNDALKARIHAIVRTELSPRHVPNEIIAVREIPRTLTGKKLEVPIKRLLLGHSLEKILNRDAIANPTSLDWFSEFARRLNEQNVREEPL